MPKNFFLLLFFLSLLFSGCSQNEQLNGKVTFSDDQSPVPTGTIFLVTKTLMSQGAIQPDGTYVVGSLSADDGLPKGVYQVYFGGVETTSEKRLPDGTIQTDYTSLIDPKYTKPETSGLTFTVNGKNHRFDVQLDRAPKKGK